MQLNKKQEKVLLAVCEALIPPINKSSSNQAYWQKSPVQIGIIEKITTLVEQVSLAEQKEFKLLLSILANPVLGLSWFGPLRPFYNLNKEQQENLLRKWSHSPISDIRKGYNSLKKLCGFAYFGTTNEKGINANWAFFDYQKSPTQLPSEIAKFSQVDLTKKSKLQCDVLIIGSGAGGSVVAAELAAKGQKVLIVEKGGAYSEEDFNQNEVEMFSRLYEKGGLSTTRNGSVSILAGSCLGGGTVINWAGSFRTPDYVLEEWASEHQNPHFLDKAYHKGFEEIEKRIHVNSNLIKHNPQNEALFKGAKKLNYKVKIIPRNIQKQTETTTEAFWKGQGFSCFGDANGTKQSALRTFLKEAVANGAEILANTNIKKVIVKAGTAVGAEGMGQLQDGTKIKIEIQAKKVVVAAGSIHSPAILKRSGLRHQQLGRNLFYHPTVAVSGVYDHPVKAWQGPMMTAVCDEFTRLDGNYGFKLETPPLHPGFAGASIPWTSGEKYKSEMLEYKNTANFIILTRDKFGGQVKLDRSGNPIMHYKLHAYDKQHMLKGIEEACKIHRAAGAQKIKILHNNPITYEQSKNNFEACLTQIKNRKWQKNYFGLFSAHQMATCRMGGNKVSHPIKPNGESWAINNLFVADASAFPNASGANPMVSIQTLAYYIAQQIIS